MAIKARAQITLTDQTDALDIVSWYRLTSSMTVPEKPTTTKAVETPSGWSKTEPAFTDGSTSYLYTCLQLVWGDGSCTWGDVSLSSSYEAAKAAYNSAQSALAVADKVAAMVHQYEDGVIVARPGQSIGAHVNADGSFDVVEIEWDGNTPAIATNSDGDSTTPLARLSAEMVSLMCGLASLSAQEVSLMGGLFKAIAESGAGTSGTLLESAGTHISMTHSSVTEKSSIALRSDEIILDGDTKAGPLRVGGGTNIEAIYAGSRIVTGGGTDAVALWTQSQFSAQFGRNFSYGKDFLGVMNADGSAQAAHFATATYGGTTLYAVADRKFSGATRINYLIVLVK